MQLSTILIYASVALVCLVALFGYILKMGWVGVRGLATEGGHKPYKTLWDWMDLLIVPAVLALGGLLLSQAQEVRQQDLLDQRDDHSRVQGYLDQVSLLLLDDKHPLRASERGSDVRTVARARTLTVLRGLDSEDKRSIVRFLDEAGLIQREGPGASGTRGYPIVNLEGANLSFADLSGIDLSQADLSGVDLTSANLAGVRLTDADLTNANLTNAGGVTEKRLRQATDLLEGATMPGKG